MKETNMSNAVNIILVLHFSFLLFQTETYLFSELGCYLEIFPLKVSAAISF